MTLEKFTLKAQDAVARAQQLAAEHGQQQIEPEHLHLDLHQFSQHQGAHANHTPSAFIAHDGLPEIMPLDQLENAYLTQLAARHVGDNANLAYKLGISERTLYRKLKQARAENSSNMDK